ncbi:MAG: T9SS type A sorting domain-containing protein [Bacteroidetes bacterium]|nr:T9SS type A sorting domain-containing protein [Bacteroidota bacterium]
MKPPPHTVFSSSDSSILLEIAIQNPLVGGPGILMARVLLNLEIYDAPLSGARIRNVPSAVASEILFEVFPIPTHQLLSIRTNANTENAHLQIHAIDGRMLRNLKYQPQIDIASLSVGVYFLTLKSESESVTVKFVKN